MKIVEGSILKEYVKSKALFAKNVDVPNIIG